MTQRCAIQHAFDVYREAMGPLLKEFGATEHWAKIELPRWKSGDEMLPVDTRVQNDQSHVDSNLETKNLDGNLVQARDYFVQNADVRSSSSCSGDGYSKQLGILRARLAERYDLRSFELLRRSVDPKRILMNNLIEQLLP